MQLKKWIQMIVISSAMVALTACHSNRKPGTDQSAINDANAAYNGPAQTSGVGDDSRFGDQARHGSPRSSERIYYFDFDRTEVRSEAKPGIIANANYLVAHPHARVLLEGHTDPRGSREYNIGLGERRAKAVAEVMTHRGVNPGQIRIVSYGAQKLASPGHSEADFQLDRRVVLVYLQR